MTDFSGERWIISGNRAAPSHFKDEGRDENRLSGPLIGYMNVVEVMPVSEHEDFINKTNKELEEIDKIVKENGHIQEKITKLIETATKEKQ